MKNRTRGVLAIAVVFVLAGGSVARAGTPGHWTRLTDMTASNIDEVSLARTADGVLHAAWTGPTPATPSSGRDVLVSAISPTGGVGTASVVQSDWATMANPSLVASGGNGLYLFLGATRSINPGETISNLALLASSDGGATWSLDPADVTTTGAAYTSDVSAALGVDGTPFVAWGSASCLCVHRGISPATANSDFQQGLGNYGYEAGIALDPSAARPVVAWYSNGTGHNGVYAAPVDPSTGALAGPQMQMPGTADLADGPFSGRTQVLARPGGGVYVAYEGGYPSHTRVLLWRVGDTTSSLLAQNPRQVRSVGVASTPTGRLWIFWSAQSSSGSPIVYARRSNPTASTWGATVVVKPPTGASTSWNLVGNGQASRLDLVGSFSSGASSTAASYHTQLLPGLSLTASPSRLHVRTARAQKVTFSVSDAGSAVSGVKVRVGSASGTTNAKGKVTLKLGPFAHRRQLLVRATQGNYTAASVSLSVK
ncbi:MAG TPA: hypothetical protein VG295_14795 [Solirubrobacteraceae bacterium]|nr:hypothetical protein [Solirubrobacteraceae bacterium]